MLTFKSRISAPKSWIVPSWKEERSINIGGEILKYIRCYKTHDINGNPVYKFILDRNKWVIVSDSAAYAMPYGVHDLYVSPKDKTLFSRYH